jgi:hypothetical protein
VAWRELARLCQRRFLGAGLKDGSVALEDQRVPFARDWHSERVCGKGWFQHRFDGLGRVLVSAPDINNRVLEISAPPVRPQTPFVLFGHRFGELSAITLFAALTLKVFFARKPNPRRLGSSDLEREIFGTRQR